MNRFRRFLIISLVPALILVVTGLVATAFAIALEAELVPWVPKVWSAAALWLIAALLFLGETDEKL